MQTDLQQLVEGKGPVSEGASRRQGITNNEGAERSLLDPGVII